MGYFSNIHGEIRFEPALTWAEISALPENMTDHKEAASDASLLLFLLVVEEETREVPEGSLVVRSSSRIAPRWDDAVKAYGTVADLEQLVRLIPGERCFSGEFRVEGEENGDVRRLWVDEAGAVVEWRAQLLWPDGSTEDNTHDKVGSS